MVVLMRVGVDDTSVLHLLETQRYQRSNECFSLKASA